MLTRPLRDAYGFVRALVLEDRWTAGVALVHALFAVAGLGWDLPSAFGWENDGVAPRDLFPCVVQSLTPGHGYNYPPFHCVLILLLSLPVLVVTVLGAQDFSLAALKLRVLQVAPMTGVSLIAKSMTVLMSTLTLLLVARIARRAFGPRAGVWTTIFAMGCLPFAFYGRMSNLDAPYLFWSVLACERLVSAVLDDRPRDYVRAGAFAALSVATKDQAYATFVLPGLSLLILPALGKKELGPTRRYLGHLLRAAGIFALVYAVASAALFNPTGFWHRVKLLRGPNSQDWRSYQPGLEGVRANLVDLWERIDLYWWPRWIVIAALAGVAFALIRPAASWKQRWVRALPLVVALSSLLFFTLVVGRAELRFVLPAGLWMSVYLGALASFWLSLTERLRTRSGGQLIRAVPLGLGLAATLETLLVLHFTQWGDARFAVERYLRDLPAGTRVETYGNMVYLPRFHPDEGRYSVVRLDTVPVRRRNPLVGGVDSDASFSAVADRAPDVLIIPDRFAERFLPTRDPGPGHRVSRVHARALALGDATRFFRAALDDRLPGYRVRWLAAPHLPGFLQALGAAPLEHHGTTGNRVWVLERVGFSGPTIPGLAPHLPETG